MSSVALVIVAKAPEVGKVKTRLCPPLTYEQAARLFTGFLLDTVELCQATGYATKIVCPTPHDRAALQKLLTAEVGYVVQEGAGLTAALSSAFKQCLANGFRSVLCVSSDNPTLPVDYLHQAVAALDEAELVFGPSEDGGYYLVGANALYPSLFEDMVWSTSSVLQDTLARATNSNLTYQLLPLWYDLDTGQELRRFVEGLKTQPNAAPYTQRALDEAGIELL